MKVEFGIEKVNVTPESSCRMGVTTEVKHGRMF